MSREIISTANAPAAIGPYSQAIRCGHTVYLSGQIPLDPSDGKMVEGPIEVHIRRVFDNLRALSRAAGGDLDRIAKLNVFLTDLGNFAEVNRIMAEPAARRAGRDGCGAGAGLSGSSRSAPIASTQRGPSSA
jgi:reactive intermediate/imine deaminase